MITLMKLERSLSSKQLVRSRAAASCPAQPCNRAQRHRVPRGSATGTAREEVGAPMGCGGPRRGEGASLGWGAWQSHGQWSGAALQDTHSAAPGSRPQFPGL